LWREQAWALAERQELVGHLTNEDPAPSKFTASNQNSLENTEHSTPQLTDAFIAWPKFDLDTTPVVWEALKNAYAQESKEREFTLRQQLTYL
jgi:hypothetical protein